MTRHSGNDTLSRTERHERWRAHVDAQAGGALPQRAYCEAHGLAYSSFTYWRRRLRAPAAPAQASVPPMPAPGSAFVPVLVSSPAHGIRGGASPPALSVVLPGGIRIDGIEAANVSVVAALVSAL